MESETISTTPDDTEQEHAETLYSCPLYRYQLANVRLWEVRVERRIETEADEAENPDVVLRLSPMVDALSARLSVNVESLTHDQELRYHINTTLEGIFEPRMGLRPC